MFSPVALIGIALASCVMSVAVLGSLFQVGMSGLRRCGAAYALLSIALALIAASGEPTDAIVVVASTLVLFAALFILQGFRQFFLLPPAFLPEYFLLGVLLAAIGYWTYVAPDVDARVSVISAFLAYTRFIIGWMAYRLRPPGRPKYAYLFVSITAAVGALIHTVRGLVYGFGWEHQSAFLAPTPLNTAFLAMGILSLPCLSIGMLMLAHDRLAERLERLATVDELTGVLVRRAFMGQAEALRETARASGSGLSLAILDIDNFKAINDRYGHAAGDHALAHFAALISQGIRPIDVFGRLGGEEFALLFPSTGKAEATRLMNRLRTTVAASSFRAPVGEISFTFSAGVEELGDGDTLASLMERSDVALYAAKAAGRNCVVAAPPLREPRYPGVAAVDCSYTSCDDSSSTLRSISPG